jgi:hypothetical protein
MLVPLSRVLDALRDAGLVTTQSASLPETIGDIVDDSRRVQAGSAFLAVKGATQDGHAWLPTARAAGATLAIVEEPQAADAAALPYVAVRDGRRAAAVAAAAFHDWPSRALTLVGVTGTNGKTTTVGLLRHLLDSPEHPAASIGTLGVLLGSAGEEMPGGGGLTTPGPVELQRLLRTLVDRGIKAVAMETSSHALDQRRVDALDHGLDLVDAMGRQMKAEREKRASILEAEGARASEILRAEGEKQAQILQAEGRKEAAYRDAEARERLAEAEAKATQMVSDAISAGNVAAVNYFIADKYVQALKAIGTAPNQKVIMMPLEASSLIGSVAGISELLKETFPKAGETRTTPRVGGGA